MTKTGERQRARKVVKSGASRHVTYLLDSVEDRETKVGATALPRRHATHHVGTVFNGICAAEWNAERAWGRGAERGGSVKRAIFFKIEKKTPIFHTIRQLFRLDN